MLPKFARFPFLWETRFPKWVRALPPLVVRVSNIVQSGFRRIFGRNLLPSTALNLSRKFGPLLVATCLTCT